MRWFVQHWQLQATFWKVRDHFSLVTLLGGKLTSRGRRVTAASAWYRKQRPTCSDTLAAMRRELWREQGLVTSGRTTNL